MSKSEGTAHHRRIFSRTFRTRPVQGSFNLSRRGLRKTAVTHQKKSKRIVITVKLQAAKCFYMRCILETLPYNQHIKYESRQLVAFTMHMVSRAVCTEGMVTSSTCCHLKKNVDVPLPSNMLIGPYCSQRERKTLVRAEKEA